MKTFTFKNGAVDYIKASLVAMGKNDVSYHLNSLCIDCTEDNPVIVATDGYRFTKSNLQWDVTIESDTHEFGKWILSREACEWIAKLKRPKPLPQNYTGLEVTVTFHPDHVVCSSGGESKRFGVIDSRFPDWRWLIPAELAESVEPMFLNSSHLADVDRWAGLITNGSKFKVVHILPHCDKKIVFKTQLGDGHIYLLMQCRDFKASKTK